MKLEFCADTLLTQFESSLAKTLPSEQVAYSALIEAARYSLFNGGKRIRPLLTLTTALCFNGSLEAALVPACALEMIHTYSLAHDDLPCMDDDDFRRGKPSLHRAFTEAHAVLAGDYLLTHAFHLLAISPQLDNEKKVRLIALLSEKASANGMIGGQVLDIEAEGKSLSLEQLKDIHANKTGALITAAVLCGGIVADVCAKDYKTLEQFGQDLGLAFQIADDILDADTDCDLEKPSYVSLMGMQGAKQMADVTYQACLAQLSKLSIDTSPLRELSHKLVFRSA